MAGTSFLVNEHRSSTDCWLAGADGLASLGATLPHGMVKVGMDTDSPGNVRVCCFSLRLDAESDLTASRI